MYDQELWVNRDTFILAHLLIHDLGRIEELIDTLADTDMENWRSLCADILPNVKATREIDWECIDWHLVLEFLGNMEIPDYQLVHKEAYFRELMEPL